MSETISKASVCEILSDIYPTDGEKVVAVKEVDKAYEAIQQLPSVQPEIIRCEDCENWIQGYITDHDDFIPPKCGKYQQMVGHSSGDYCSLAERKTNG